ncbi:MAG: DAK2 domain-containing protein, partial [Janthinobacterium lividum]
AGCSLTVMWLDDELERLWLAPADTPTFRRGAVPGTAAPRRRVEDAAATEAPPTVQADADGTRAARAVSKVLDALAAALAEAEPELGRIDAVAGDGDHGRGMAKGSAAASAAAQDALAAGAGPAGVLTAAGTQWADRAGGTSGVLWGAALTAFGRRLGDLGLPSDTDVVAAVRDSYEALVDLGGASPGDKTMLDAWLPFADALESGVAEGGSWLAAWGGAAETAQRAADATADLSPKVGRARPLAERSLGTPDAGAVSFALCVRVAGQVLGTGADDEVEEQQ